MLFALLIPFVLQFIIIYVPFFNDIFKTKPLTLRELGITLTASVIVFFVVEIEKMD
jgi:Ca2+-transporting ATPase